MALAGLDLLTVQRVPWGTFKSFPRVQDQVLTAGQTEAMEVIS